MWKWADEGNSAGGLWDMRLALFFVLAEGSRWCLRRVLVDKGETVWEKGGKKQGGNAVGEV